MSWQAATWATDPTNVAPLSHTERHVLLLMANRAMEDGTEIRPSTATLSKQSGLSVRAVRGIIDRLEDKGFIECTGTWGTRKDRLVKVYCLPALRDAAGAEPQVERHAAGAGRNGNGVQPAQNGVQGVQVVTPPRGAAAAPNSSLRTEPDSSEDSSTPAREGAREAAEQGQLVVVEPVPKPRAQRPPNPLWDAVMEVCHIDVIPQSSRGKYNAAVRQLALVGATPDDVRMRAAVYRAMFTTTLTPNALVSQWGVCNPDALQGVAQQTYDGRQMRSPVAMSNAKLKAEAEELRRQEARDLEARERRARYFSLGS